MGMNFEICDTRMAAGLTVREAAEVCGMAHLEFSEVERGLRPARADIIARLTDYLNQGHVGREIITATVAELTNVTAFGLASPEWTHASNQAVDDDAEFGELPERVSSTVSRMVQFLVDSEGNE